MITNIIIILWIAFILYLVYVLLNSIYIKNKKANNYMNNLPFQYVYTDIPFITLNIQGKKYNMIVDSGAAVSIISESVLESLSYEESDKKYDLVAMTEEAVPSNVVIIPITVNGKEIREEFVRHPAEDIACYKSRYGVVIHGLLSYNFLKKAGCKIDFENKKFVV